MAKRHKKKLGDLLKESGMLTEMEIVTALDQKKKVKNWEMHWLNKGILLNSNYWKS